MNSVCSLCMGAFLNSASFIRYVAPDGTSTPIYEYGDRGIHTVLRILSGDHPNLEPGGTLYINEYRTELYATTMIAGTALCITHAFDKLTI